MSTASKTSLISQTTRTNNTMPLMGMVAFKAVSKKSVI